MYRYSDINNLKRNLNRDMNLRKIVKYDFIKKLYHSLIYRQRLSSELFLYIESSE